MHGCKTTDASFDIELHRDFRQTLPIIPRLTPGEEINACLNYSILWRHRRIMSPDCPPALSLRTSAVAIEFQTELIVLQNPNLLYPSGTPSFLIYDSSPHD
ncbi:unnamed protein product [Onchocerca flexuosa]|uniref:Uncharacterized protein n=1 Tax=Onchocerca flexuosa TaxID=387005 RepID=A0A183I083_9BILA|nr:unnamed protein product [Onchocerca flexuosa]